MSDTVSNTSTHSTTSESPRTVDHSEFEPWLEAMLTIAAHYRLECSAENVRISTHWNQQERVESVLRHMARQAGLSIKFAEFSESMLATWRLPIVVQLRDGQVAVIDAIDNQGNLNIIYSGDQGLHSSIHQDAIARHILRVLILRPLRAVKDARVDDYIKPHDKKWFRKIILRDIRPYGHVMLATTVANTLALAGIIFSRQVYDRVIPAESFPTLYVLFSGVLLAVAFDFVMRLMRVRITDLLGKRADIRVSDLVFGHAIRLKNSVKPRSTGTFISQIRELEQVREMITSTTATALADLPFFLLFLFVFWMVAGPLIMIPVIALFLLIIPGLFAQKKLARLAAETMRESSLRNAMLVESVQGMEDIKSLRAEQRFQHQWNHYNAVTADANLKLRFVVNMLTVWTHNVQSSIFAVIVLFGAPMVMSGDLTTGSLVAASILGSRMMAPMAHVTQIMSRWQQTKVALQSLDQIMQLPVDHPEGSKRVHKPVVHGNFDIKQASFRYGSDCGVLALKIHELAIKPGERIAILGRNGAGKSTLLQALAGMIEPLEGEVNLDGVSLAHIDPADVRRDVVLLSQNAVLFHGTLRENVTMGAPNASDDEVIAALDITGAAELVRKSPLGMDHLVHEGGLGLSGGQRQSLLLARFLLQQPQVALLDEPTASLDDATERKFINGLAQWNKGRTLVVATHRSSILKLVDRILVVDNGHIVVDDLKDVAIANLSRPREQTAAAQSEG